MLYPECLLISYEEQSKVTPLVDSQLLLDNHLLRSISLKLWTPLWTTASEQLHLVVHFFDAGVSHGDEVRYLFPIHPEWPYTPNDKEVIKLMLSLWTNFAKFGWVLQFIPTNANCRNFRPFTNFAIFDSTRNILAFYVKYVVRNYLEGIFSAL
jgi:hypothetical protein